MRRRRERRGNLPQINDRREFRAAMLDEKRALQADADIYGGFLVVGAMINELLQQERQISVMRAISRVLDPLKEVDEVGVPSQEAAMAGAEWTTELVIGSQDTTASFGKRVLHPHLISKEVRVSKKLLRVQPTAESWINEALANAVATPQESAFIQGSGSGEPTGLLNTTGLAVYTTQGSGAVTGEDIRKWLFKLPARFQARARILTSVDFLRHILTTKDANGNFLFPDYRGSILNVPVSFTDGLPDIVDDDDNLVAGEYAAVVGDFRFYWIQDAYGIEVQRLKELYAEVNEVGFIIRQETDGMAVVANAFYALQIKS